MRTAPILIVLLAMALSGCAVIFPVAEVVTRPMDKKGTFEDIQRVYSANIRFGLYDDVVPMVEPALQERFRGEISRFRELRFSDVRTESIEMDALRTQARVVVVYRGYSLSSPFEREFRVVQQWKRTPPSQNWYITPDFDGLLSPKDVSREPSQPASLIQP
ncbi:MAG: hypothetical protein JRH01_18690 [Deltaproteobacteria bacterium]|nr:hypothetical protein [Deltaproteobacteria bacterium]MBW2394653.1 hypothetical protein [Deltaproteobacteria bacterium]